MSHRQLGTQDGCPKEKSAWGTEISKEIMTEFRVDEQLQRESRKKGRRAGGCRGQLPYFGSRRMKRKSRPHCHYQLMLWFSVALDS